MALRLRSTLLLSAELVAFLALVGVARPHAQSLGDLANQEQERRKAIKTPGKVYTNDDLKAVPAPRPPDAGDVTTSAPSDNDNKDGSAAGSSDKASADGQEPTDESKGPEKDATVKDQKYWADRMAALEATSERDQTFATALQVEINALTTDFTNRDDPAQRAVVGQNRQKALDDLATLKLTIVDDQKAIDNLSEEARREGVPPGWLR